MNNDCIYPNDALQRITYKFIKILKIHYFISWIHPVLEKCVGETKQYIPTRLYFFTFTCFLICKKKLHAHLIWQIFLHLNNHRISFCLFCQNNLFIKYAIIGISQITARSAASRQKEQSTLERGPRVSSRLNYSFQIEW